MTATDSRIRLLVDGEAFPNWTSYSLKTDLRRPAGTFTVRASTASRSVPLTPGGTVVLKVGGRQVLWGRVDDVAQRLEADADELEISGRDAGGVLLSCAADPAWRWRNQLLSTIADQVGSFAGVSRPASLEFDPTIKDWKVEPGDSCWAVLRNLVESEGMKLWAAADGSLKISPWITYGTASGRLVRRAADPKANNVISSDSKRSFRDAFSEVRVLGEWDSGLGTNHVSGTWLDLTAPTFRLGVFQEKVRSQAAADNRAADIGRQAAATRLELDYLVAGHLNGQGFPWAVNELVELADDAEDVEGDFLIVGASFTNGADGQRTRLTVVDPATITGGADA